MSDISPGLRAEVVLRAGNRCEYCQLSQLGQEATLHTLILAIRQEEAARGRHPPA